MLSSQLCTDSDFFFFKQKTAYEMRISDWSSDVCSSDLPCELLDPVFGDHSGIIAGAACNDADAPDLRQIERERGQGDLLLQRAEIGAKRLRDDHRLLENLLLHEVAVIALVDQRAGAARHGDRPVHRLVVTVLDCTFVAGDTHPVALFQISK